MRIITVCHRPFTRSNGQMSDQDLLGKKHFIALRNVKVLIFYQTSLEILMKIYCQQSVIDIFTVHLPLI